ncbi:MAG: MBG domain-containing protein, partial [Chthoniobacterales bacterium]
LSITANDITKPFGQTLSLGAGQTGFGASGLVNGETVGSVTITASGGTAAEDPAGAYTLTPSAATGGTFTPSNYSIIYNTGTLTVTGAGIPTFEQWMSTNYPQLTGGDALAAADPDKDGIANLLEYYMGLSPVAANHNAISVAFTPGSPSSLSMSYRRSKNITNVIGGVLWISTLTTNNWSTNGVTVNAIGATDYDDVTATVTNGPSDAAKFLRLRVQQQ